MRFFALALATLVACAPPISRGGEGDDTDAGRSTDAGSSTDAGTSGPSGSLRACVLSPDGSIDSANCTRLDDDPPRLPTLDFGTASPGAPPTLKLRVFDDGPGPLHIASLTFADAAYTSDAEPRDLEFGESTTFTLTFAPTTDGDHATTLTIATDDSAHPNVALPVSGSASGFTPKLCVDPNPVAFETVLVGESKPMTVTLTNCGQVAVDVSTIALTENGADAVDFSMSQPPSLPLAIQPAGTLSIDVTFQPSGVGDFTGSLDLGAGEASSSIALTGSGTVDRCRGAPPTAVIHVRKGSTDITSNPTVQPLDTVTFDATASTVPNGGATYAWRLVSQPQNGTQNVSRPTGTTTSLLAELVGDYVVELIATDQYGCDSSPLQIAVHVKPNDALHVQLTWAESHGDLDLHLLGPNGTFDDAGGFTGGGSDCFYANCKDHTLDWGLNGGTKPDGNLHDDPNLDIDQLWGNGPENISDASPFAATYTVLVHDYCSRQQSPAGTWGPSQGPVTATLRVFVNGIEQLTATKSMTQRDKWTVATLAVQSDGSITVTPSTTAVTKSTGTSDACTSDTN